MGRLIDADTLIEWINKQREEVTKKQVTRTEGSIFTREDLVAMQRCLSTFETAINNQPTAFDKDKAVAELEKRRIEYELSTLTTTDGILQVYRNGLMRGFEYSQDIIRKGGVE